MIALLFAMFFVISFTVDNNLDKYFSSDVQKKSELANNEIELLKNEALKSVKWFEYSGDFVDSITTWDHDEALAIGQKAMESFGLGYLVITNTNGEVLVRAHDPENYNDSILNQVNIANAISGKASVGIEEGKVVKMSIRAGCPIRDESGNIIGAISGGYVLGDESFTEKLKGLTNTEVMIYSGKDQTMSTFFADGQRYLGSPLDDDTYSTLYEQRSSITRFETINSNVYYVSYSPILSVKDQVLGVMVIAEDLGIKSTMSSNLTYVVMAVIVISFLIIVSLLIYFSRRITKPLRNAIARMTSLAHGDLSTSVDVVKGHDEVAALTETLNITVNQLQGYIGDITRVLSSMADNDFTVISDAEYLGDFLPIKHSLSQISESLNQTLGFVNQSTILFHNSADEMADSAQSLAQGATEQSVALSQLLTSISLISDEVNNNAKNASKAADYVEDAVRGIQDGNGHMQKMMVAMNDIQNTSNEIKKIIKSIDDIAFQTNILALNAAVEAARAGTAGKGFAVVADEVRSLASRSAEAAKHTSDLIHDSITAVVEGYKLAEITGSVFSSVAARTLHVKDVIIEVNKASTAQANEIKQLTQGFKELSDVNQTNSASAEESAAASLELTNQTSQLKSVVEKFQLKRVLRLETRY
jgi:methyl-accepting chemotaxis protein